MKQAASSRLEQRLRRQGYALIAGADEVGRGALAGPLVVGCVVLAKPLGFKVWDSKLLNRSQREQLAQRILQNAEAVSYGVVEPTEIDTNGLAAALRLGYRRAVDGLTPSADYYVLDGNVNYLTKLSTTSTPSAQAIIRADQLHACVAAASIVAKVYRDRLMIEAAGNFPQFGFDRHVGYGTAAHRLALNDHGPCPLHRRSFLKFLAAAT